MLTLLMVVVGVTGGPASGKSTVARLFKACGADVIDADRLARRAVAPGTPGWRDVVAAFGRGILNPDRTIARARLGRIVFRDRRKRRRLEAIIHPRVHAAFTRRLAQISTTRPRAVVIYDVPLLIETGLHKAPKAQKAVDRVVVVTADREAQLRRLTSRDGLSRSEALRRLRAQLPLAAKRRHADHVLDGTFPLPRLRAHVERLYRVFAQATHSA